MNNTLKINIKHSLSLVPHTFFGLLFILSLFSCNQAKKEMMESTQMAESKANDFISSTATVENKKDTVHKFIRTADLKFKVKNVIQSTNHIEDLTNRQGGFVTYTNLTSTIDQVTTIPVSKDSSLETTYYSVLNSIIIRVPNTKLDTTLKQIARNIEFLDFRLIKAEDVGLQILSNNLTQKRSAKNEKRLTNAIDNRGKKLNETTVAEDVLLSKEAESDAAKISNLSLIDQISFSTINLTIYQKQSIKRELIYNDKNIEAFEPGFGSKIFEAFKYGWEILVSLMIFLTKLWGLFLFIGIVYIIFRIYRDKLKK